MSSGESLIRNVLGWIEYIYIYIVMDAKDVDDRLEDRNDCKESRQMIGQKALKKKLVF